MLSINQLNDIEKMLKYYRTSDMLYLLYFFPELSPIRDLTILEKESEYFENKDFWNHFQQNRVDTLKGRRPILEIENSGESKNFYQTFLKVKACDPLGVLVLFNLNCLPTKRYERWAGISVGVDLGKRIYIDAVSKGIDVHERYEIPWFDLRNLSLSNFKEYQVYQIHSLEYQISRRERIQFLKSIGLKEEEFLAFIPKHYQKIPDFIWLSVISRLLKCLEKNEDFLANEGFTNFMISGHTEGKVFAPWQMSDQKRYTLVKKT